MKSKRKKLKGFAALTPERRREIASLGGTASARNWDENPSNFSNNRELARAAGRKGGLKKRKK